MSLPLFDTVAHGRDLCPEMPVCAFHHGLVRSQRRLEPDPDHASTRLVHDGDFMPELLPAVQVGVEGVAERDGVPRHLFLGGRPRSALPDPSINQVEPHVHEVFHQPKILVGEAESGRHELIHFPLQARHLGVERFNLRFGHKRIFRFNQCPTAIAQLDELAMCSKPRAQVRAF